MWRIVVIIALAVLAGPALGQAMDFQQLLSGAATPASMQLKDLNGDWRRVVIAPPESGAGGMGDMMKQLMTAGMASEMGRGGPNNDSMMGLAFMSSMFGGESKGQIYYTKGQTVTVAGESFLIAYRIERQEPNLMSLIMESQQSGKTPDFARLAADAKLKPESTLVLSLLNVKSIGGLSGIRPFDLNRELADDAASSSIWDMLAKQATRPAPPAPTPVKKPAAPSTRPRGK